MLLYHLTETVFGGTAFFQQSEEVLMKGFVEMLAYYDDTVS